MFMVQNQSPRGVSLKKNLLKISKYSLENTKVTLEIFFIFSIENRLHHRCFLVDFAKILRAAPVQNTSG